MELRARLAKTGERAATDRALRAAGLAALAACVRVAIERTAAREEAGFIVTVEMCIWLGDRQDKVSTGPIGSRRSVCDGQEGDRDCEFSFKNEKQNKKLRFALATPLSPAETSRYPDDRATPDARGQLPVILVESGMVWSRLLYIHPVPFPH